MHTLNPRQPIRYSLRLGSRQSQQASLSNGRRAGGDLPVRFTRTFRPKSRQIDPSNPAGRGHVEGEVKLHPPHFNARERPPNDFDGKVKLLIAAASATQAQQPHRMQPRRPTAGCQPLGSQSFS